MIVHASRADDLFVGLRKRGAASSLRLRARATREVESANSRPSAFCAAGRSSVTRAPPSGELSGESCVRFLRIGEASHSPLERIATIARRPTPTDRPCADPRTGFLLSLIDGSTTLETIVDVSGMPKADALRILRDFVEGGIVRFALEVRSARSQTCRQPMNPGASRSLYGGARCLPAYYRHKRWPSLAGKPTRFKHR
jgi:hypothetical protein